MNGTDNEIPTLQESLGRGIVVFFISWCMVALVLGVLIPIDPTGDVATDLANRPTALLVNIAAITAAAGIAFLDVIQWRRKKHTHNGR